MKKSSFEVRNKKLFHYLIIIIVLGTFSVFYTVSLYSKDHNVIKSKKLRPPPRYYHRNKVSVVSESEIFNNMDDDNNDYSTSKKRKEPLDKDTMMMSQFKKYIINTVSTINELGNMNLLREKTELHRIVWERVFGTEIFSSDHILDSMLKYQEEDPQLVKLFNKVHKNLYPWLYGKKYLAIDELVNSFRGRGIVICTGSEHFKYAQSTIDTLRNLIKTRLPIEVFYNGDDELTFEEKQALMMYPNVYLSDIQDYFNNDVIKIRKWAIKPFAMLASRFMEVILIDADSMFIRDPAELFRSDGYEETGTLFFRDRTIKKPEVNDSLMWFKEWAKNPLVETKNSRFWNGLTIHEMDSSTVVINKEKAILGLLSVCKMNEYEVRERMVYKHVYGDKETFWMGFDMARQHYYMSKQPIYFIGQIQPDNKYSNEVSGDERKMLCGHIAHVSDDGMIIFWNGHLVVDKTYNYNTLLNFESYIIEKDSDDNSKWTEKPVCYHLDYEDDAIPLSDNDRVFIDMIKERESHNHILVK